MLHPTYLQRALRGAVDYAKADRSDPFTFSRVMSHLQIGVCSPRFHNNGTKIDCLYEAESIIEARKLKRSTFSDGSTGYHVQTYRNMVRP